MRNKSLILHHTVSIRLNTPENFINLVLCKALTQRRKHMLNLNSQHKAVPILVKNFHTLSKVLLSTSRRQLRDLSQNWQKLVEGDLLGVEVLARRQALAQGVFHAAVGHVDDLLPLLVGGGPAEGADGSADLVPVDLALAFGVEQLPVVFPLFELVLAEAVRHFCSGGNKPAKRQE